MSSNKQERPSQALRRRTMLPQSLGAIVEFTGGEEEGRRVPLVYQRTVLGRKFGDVLIADLEVSATHAVLEYVDGAFSISDVGSSNGTFLRGTKVSRGAVGFGEEVRVGSTSFRLILNPEQFERLLASRPRDVFVSEEGLTDLLEREFFSDRPEVRAERTTPAQKTSENTLAKFMILLGPDHGKIFTSARPKVVIGRAKADLLLRDNDVSRKHALIERQHGGQLVLMDLASRNGTFVNGRRISNHVLQEGDRVRVGQTTIVFSGTVSDRNK